MFSYIQHCEVLEASEPHQKEWIAETLGYLRDRFPLLTDLQVARLRVMGHRYLAPPIPRGADRNHLNREVWEHDAASPPSAVRVH